MNKRTDDLAKQAQARSDAESRANGGQSVQGNSDAAQPRVSRPGGSNPVTDSERLRNEQRAQADEIKRGEGFDSTLEHTIVETDSTIVRPGDNDAARTTVAQPAPHTTAPDKSQGQS